MSPTTRIVPKSRRPWSRLALPACNRIQRCMLVIFRARQGDRDAFCPVLLDSALFVLHNRVFVSDGRAMLITGGEAQRGIAASKSRGNLIS